MWLSIQAAFTVYIYIKYNNIFIFVLVKGKAFKAEFFGVTGA